MRDSGPGFGEAPPGRQDSAITGSPESALLSTPVPTAADFFDGSGGAASVDVSVDQIFDFGDEIVAATFVRETGRCRLTLDITRFAAEGYVFKDFVHRFTDDGCDGTVDVAWIDRVYERSLELGNMSLFDGWDRRYRQWLSRMGLP